jgi:hypothetical protein
LSNGSTKLIDILQVIKAEFAPRLASVDVLTNKLEIFNPCTGLYTQSDIRLPVTYYKPPHLQYLSTEILLAVGGMD